MERSGSSDPASAAVHPADVVAVFDTPGPYLTVWLDTPGDVQQAAERVHTRWRSLRSDLADQGAPEGLLDAVERVTVDAYKAGAGLVVIGAGDGVLLVEHLPEPPRAEVARWASLPSLAPVLEHRQSLVPHVVVLTDRQGADLVVVSAEPDQQPETKEVDPEREVLASRATADDSTHRRHQHRAENTWEHNAKGVADEVVAAVDRSDARLVVTAGDVRAVQLLNESLPDRVRALVHEVPGGRADDGSKDTTDADIARLVRTAIAAQTVAVLERFHEELGQHDRAANGVPGTLAALAAARVSVLLAHDDPEDERTAWFDPASAQVAASRDDLDALNIDDPTEGRAVDAALRSALLTGAGIRFVPAHGSITDGLGALLRW